MQNKMYLYEHKLFKKLKGIQFKINKNEKLPN